MAVYVDEARHPYGRMMMCHMMADSTAELLAMADRIGVARKWIQKAGTPYEHFDISKGKRAEAIAAGANEVTSRDLGRIILARREGTR
jgi:formyltetrahydrofolate hydrolase